MNSVLVIVDYQNDFVHPEGMLSVPGAEDISHGINRAIDDYDVVYATKDWHPPDHCSFMTFGGEWPAHCIAGNRGAEFSNLLKTNKIRAVFHKGMDKKVEEYSGATGELCAALDQIPEVTVVDVCGVAFDYCVKFTASAIKNNGYNVRVLGNLTKAVQSDVPKILATAWSLTSAGIPIVSWVDEKIFE